VEEVVGRCGEAECLHCEFPAGKLVCVAEVDEWVPHCRFASAEIHGRPSADLAYIPLSNYG